MHVCLSIRPHSIHIQALFMKANYLTYLRAGSLASQTNLRRLDLSRNKFSILSNNAFVGLDSLEVLNLSSNSFVHVPSASFHPLMVSLKQLDLSDNQLTQLMPGKCACACARGKLFAIIIIISIQSKWQSKFKRINI